MLPTVIASSVIRSTHRGDSHGGIYRIDLESGDVCQMLDWNNPDINWEGRGGDRGVRGLAFFGDTLYAVAGNELFAFEKDGDQLRLCGQYPSPYLKLTHEAWRHRDKLYICSGGTDSILVFDLVNKKWTTSYYHNANSNGSQPFNPNTRAGYENPTEGFMHLDSVYANDDYMWYSGAFTDGLWQYDFLNKKTTKFTLAFGDTHNARPMWGGYLYNLSRMSKTVFEKGGAVMNSWDTPHALLDSLTNTHLPRDHAVQGYTRGMVVYDDYIITGTSPAAINVFSFSSKNPIKSVSITNDIRNSICGMVLNEWS